MHFHERGALLIFLALFRRAFTRLRNRDATFFSDGAHRFGKRGLFQFHHELKNVATLAAAETVIDLLGRMHRETKESSPDETGRAR